MLRNPPTSPGQRDGWDTRFLLLTIVLGAIHGRAGARGVHRRLGAVHGGPSIAGGHARRLFGISAKGGTSDKAGTSSRSARLGPESSPELLRPTQRTSETRLSRPPHLKSGSRWLLHNGEMLPIHRDGLARGVQLYPGSGFRGILDHPDVAWKRQVQRLLRQV